MHLQCVYLYFSTNAFCLPILLYGLEAVTMSNANPRTLYVTWKTALYKIFKLNNGANLLYTQYCCFAYKLCLRFTKIMFPVQATL